ncbi:hypothetical protein D3C76_989930 [compost metagenome]
MLPEDRIRNIAHRYIEPLKNVTHEERRMILENAIREALMEDYRRRHYPEPNAGCL